MALQPQVDTLAVDLDGTLVRTDLLYESFWASLANSYATPFLAALSLMRGRVQLKHVLAEKSGLDVTLLPYDEQVINRIKAWRENGGKAVLVTACDIGLARRVADHLGIFDEVHGSDGETNLKGSVKAAFLTNRYGARNFAYIGDHKSDCQFGNRRRKLSVSLRARPCGANCVCCTQSLSCLSVAATQVPI